MIMMKTKKIIKSLKVLKKYCESQECESCVFYNNYDCELNEDTPNNWGIKVMKANLKDKEGID